MATPRELPSIREFAFLTCQPSRAGPTGGTPRELSPIWELAFLTCHVRMGHGSRTSAICEVAPGGPREPPHASCEK